MSDQPYQLMPPLSADEYASLREDIAANGIRVPIDVDEHGNVLDGHHRQRIAAELGIPCPTRLLAGLTEDEKRAHAVAVNVHRRTLTISQRRDLVRAEMDRDPSRSDRAIGRLCGVDHKTVGAIRRGGWGIPHPAAEPLTPMDKAEARRLTESIKTDIKTIDIEIIVMLLRGEPASAAIGWLAAVWHRFEQEGADLGEEFLGPLRRVLYTDRVNELLKWPAGWYGAECQREPDELREAYQAALYRMSAADRDPDWARAADYFLAGRVAAR